MRSTVGITGAKSRPGFAVPDSVHQVKLASPCGLPLRRTVMRASPSVGSTSTASAAISMRIGPPLPARADVSAVEGRAGTAAAPGLTAAAPGLGVGLGNAVAAIGAAAIGAAAIGAAAIGAAAIGAAALAPVALAAAVVLRAVAVGAGAGFARG